MLSRVTALNTRLIAQLKIGIAKLVEQKHDHNMDRVEKLAAGYQIMIMKMKMKMNHHHEDPRNKMSRLKISGPIVQNLSVHSLRENLTAVNMARKVKIKDLHLFTELRKL